MAINNHSITGTGTGPFCLTKFGHLTVLGRPHGKASATVVKFPSLELQWNHRAALAQPERSGYGP
jgi:hypothetical protein